jgi:ABC-type nitrate/sulfonate/bicarbonate transport system permease component
VNARARGWVAPLALIGVLLVAWEAYVRAAGVSAVVLPGPLRILGALWDYRADAVRHTIPTLVETVLGFAIAVVLAIGAAAAMDRVRVVRRAVEPILVTSQTIPVVALAPLFLLWFGFGLAPKVLVVVLVTFFPIVVALLDGFRSGSIEAEDLMRSYGATEGQTFRLLRWPQALPSFFTGLRISVVYAVIGAVFGEYVGAREGLGIWMQLSQNAFRTDLVFAAIVVTSALSLVLYWLVGVARRVAIPWAPGVRREPTLEERPF